MKETVKDIGWGFLIGITFFVLIPGLWLFSKKSRPQIAEWLMD